MSKIVVSELASPSDSKILFSDGITFDTPLKLKSYLATQITALTGMTAGEIIYDSTNKKVKVYTGTAWEDIGSLDGVRSTSYDVINEASTGFGVTIEGVKLQDGQVNTDTINETTASAGVTVGGVLLKGAEVSVDTINEKTADTGVTIDGVVLKDSGITVAGHILPSADVTYDLGSAGNKFRDLYLSGSSLTLGSQEITTDGTSISLPTVKTDNIQEKTPASGITIPSNVTLTGTVDASGGTTVGFPKGKFEQVVYTFNDTEATYAMPNSVDGVEVALLTTTITPTSATSEIMIMLQIFGESGHHDAVGFISRQLAGNAEVYLKPTNITGTRGAFHVGYYPDTDYNSTPHSTSYHLIDAPATNGNVTYRVRLAKTSGGTTNFRFNGTINTTTSLNYEKGHSQLTLMEILA